MFNPKLPGNILRTLCCASMLWAACSGTPDAGKIITISDQRAVGATNGPQWNGPQWNGPQWNGPQWNGPQWNGPQWNGPQWNGATDMDDTLLFGNEIYHDTWVSNPFDETNLIAKLKDVLCSFPDSVVLHYMWSLAYDSTKTANFAVKCSINGGTDEGWLIYNLRGSSNLAPGWYTGALVSSPASATTACSAEAKYLTAGWLSALNSAPSVNKAETYGGVIHNPYSLRGTQGETSKLWEAIAQTSTYFYGVESVKSTAPAPAGTNYAAKPGASWRPGGTFTAKVTANGTSLKVCVSDNPNKIDMVLGISHGLHMADYSPVASGRTISVDGRRTAPEAFTDTGDAPTPWPCIGTAPLAVGDYVFSYQFRANEVDRAADLDMAPPQVYIGVSTGSASIHTREHRVLNWREAGFWGCIFGSVRRNTSELGWVNNITSNKKLLSACSDAKPYYCGSIPGPSLSRCSRQTSKSEVGVTTSCGAFNPPASGSVNYFLDANICITNAYSNHAQYARARGCSNTVYNTSAEVCYMTNAYAPCESACSSSGTSTFSFTSPPEVVNLGDYKGCRKAATSSAVNEILTTYLGSACAAVNTGSFDSPKCFL